MSMKLEFFNEKCNQCYECLELCPSDALNLPSSDGYLTWDNEKCTYCETCRDICMEEAIKCTWD